MYSTLPPVLSELLANAYDADATKVEVQLNDINEKEIIVTDNGTGMSFNDIDKKFLVIGRNRREDGEELTPRGRKVIGKKGLGKLSFFGIVRTITVNTVQQGKRNIFTMDWDDLMNSTRGKYLMIPQVIDKIVEDGQSGTQIILTNINRESDFSEKFLANSIARFFIFDEDFSVTVRRNDEDPVMLSNDMHFSAFGEEFSWNFPEDFSNIESDYEHRSEIQGKIITPEKPIAPRFDSRGISLFSRGKLVQSPYQFSDSTSSHFFSYMTGWLEVDFIEDFSEDVISTNRQNLNWGYLQTSKLHTYLEKCVQFVQLDWRRKRKEKKIAEVDNSLGDIGLEDWKNSMPEEIQNSIEVITEKLIEDFPEIETIESNRLFVEFKKLIPSYPYYHWRNLHQLIRDRLYEDYKNARYLDAAKEGVVIYEREIRDKAGVNYSSTDLMHKSFSFESHNERGRTTITRLPILQISDLSDDTELNMQRGQQFLSVGLVQAFRNPTHHEPRTTSNILFPENSCLDILSLISFLLFRLDNVKKNG